MNENEINQALQNDRVIDITTTGRKSGEERRIEIWFHNVDGHIYITGTPGKRDWYANLKVHPDFTFHLKRSVTADIPGRARPILDENERREVLAKILQNNDWDRDLDEWVKNSPLVEVKLQV